MDIIENLESTNTLTIETSNFNLLNNNGEINNEDAEKQNLMETTHPRNQNFVSNNNESGEVDNTNSNINIDSDNNLLSPSTFANLPSPSSPHKITLTTTIPNSNNEQNVKKVEEKLTIINHDNYIYHGDQTITTNTSTNQNKFTYHIYNLPNELLIQIATLIDLKSLGRMCQTSKFFRSVFYSAEELWENLNLSRKNTIGGNFFS